MAHWGAGREAGLGEGAHRYERHRPEQTLLYRLVEQHYPAFVAELAAAGGKCPPTLRGNSRTTSSADAWSTVSCG